MSVWLLIDVSSLAHRAFHAMGDLSYDGYATGALFGLFRDIMDLEELFSPTGIGFCFDGGIDKRLELYPQYKNSRRKKKREMPEEEREERRGLYQQIYRLRTSLLAQLGYRNIFWQEGYEADDLIASACDCLEFSDRAIIVSSDSDLWQLLSSKVTIWNPRTKSPMNLSVFQKKYPISPSVWADVKAIAGDSSDDIEGIKGIGPINAVKYLTGNLKETTKAFDMIVRGTSIWKRNIELIRLPFPGVQKVQCVADSISTRAWSALMEELGMDTLRTRALGVKKR